MSSLTDVFVTVKPDVDKFEPEVKKKLARIDATKEGKQVGDRFGVGFSKSLPGIGGRVSSFFKTGLGTAAAVAGGAVLGGGLIAGFGEALGQGGANAKFQAQLGLSEADSAKAGKIAGDLFKNNYGDSVSGVNEAIKSVVQNTNVTLNSVDLKGVTAEVLNLASTFDQDLGGVTRAVGQSIRTGLAKNATEALDFITAGFQKGDDKAGDFLDTLNEYGTQFRKVGIDGKTATGLISQGLKAGARDADIVADAIKEFSIRAVDGSTTTAAGFKAVGLDAKTMAEQIAKGGKPASDGLQLVLDKLRGIKDPVKQSQAAIALFGTQAEDLGAALFALDPKSAVSALGQVAGAADKMDKTLGSTPQAAIKGFFRSLKQNSVDTLGGVITAFATGEKKAGGFQGVLQSVAVGARGIFDKIKLGAEGFKAAFSGEGITSDGFVGAMERIGVAARGAFDFFKTDILPRLKEFDGFVVDNIVPAVGNLVAAFAPLAKDVGTAVVGVFEKLSPILQSVGDFIAGTIVPAVVDFTKWLKDNSTVVGAVAVGVGAMVVAFQAYQVALAIVGAATKAYAAVQAALNLVMSLNPIGVVVLALVGLAAGLVYAYKKSETFRDIVNGVFGAVKDFAVGAFKAVVGAVKTAIDWVKNNWPLLLAILAGPIGLAVLAIVKHWDKIKAGGKAVIDWIVQTFPKVVGWITAPFVTVVQALGTAWDSIKTAAKTAIKFVVDKFLGLVQSVLDGAAKAFGWVPGLGDKLKGAATEFGKFRDAVNNKLDGINDQTVNVEIKYSSKGVNLTTPSSVGRYADGGGVFGGTRGKDSVPALLMPDEHVWTTREVTAAGGHGAMKRMRQAALAGELNGYAGGGAVGFNIHRNAPSSAGLAKQVAADAVRAAGPYIAAGAKQLAAAPGGPPGAKQAFRGVTLNQRTIAMLLNAERILGAIFHITQGSYSTRVAASGSTHAGGGAMDTNGPKGWNTAVRALRLAGFAAWHRTRSQGPWNDHIHSIALGDSSASPAAKAQMASFRRGGDGLGGAVNKAIGRGMRKGGQVGSYADGAWKILRDQLAVVHRDEMVVPAHTADSVREAIAGKLHQLHQKHVDHQAHAAHQAHLSTTGLTPSRLHPDDIRQLARALAGEIQANPPRVLLDGRMVDTQITRRALNGGY